MEYDTFTIPGYAPGEAKNFPHKSIPGSKDEGLLRYGGPGVDVSFLKEPLTFAFSGRTAKNRFLKAPMTERLCKWNKEGEDISARGYPSEEYKRL